MTSDIPPNPAPAPMPPPDAGPSHPRRSSLLLVIVAIAAAVLGAGTGAALAVRHQDQHWRPIYERAVSESARWRTDADKWRSESQRQRQSAQRYRGLFDDLKAEVHESVGDLDSPRFVLWNSCNRGGPAEGCPLTPGQYYVGGVPDTFTYFLSYRATVPVNVMIMDAHNFACWETGVCASRWIEWGDRKSLRDGVFHNAEGCAGYFAVFVSEQAGTLFPDVSIERQPASHPTGACR